jgi:hypothetical protein
VVIQFTVVSGTTPTAVAKLQESDDNAAWNDAGPANGTSFNAVGVQQLPGTIRKRYVRIAWTIGGTTPSFTYKAWLNPLVNEA